MKRLLLFTCLTSLSLAGIAQDAKPLRALTPAHYLEQQNPTLFSGNTQHAAKKPGKTRATVDAIEIGSATNALSTLQGENNMVIANDLLNTVLFIHRNDESQYGMTSAQYRYAISYDRAANFTMNVGPLNPSADNAIGGINARYPQAAIYNPAGNTDPNNAWLAYIGAWHNGSTGADTWEGLTYGAMRLNNDTATATEHNDTMNASNVLIPSSMTQGKHGEFWAVDNEFGNEANDSMILVYKGIWNASTNDVDWDIYTKLNPNFSLTNDSSFSINVVMAFDPSGKYGWIATSADLNGVTSPGVYNPVFFQSTDSGATWSSPMIVDLSTFPNVISNLDLANGTGIPTTGFDIDMVVDKNGNPHLATVVGSGTGEHSIQSGLNLNIYDITYNGTAWDVVRLDTIFAIRGEIGTSSTGAYSQDNRPQLSTSPDGSKVVYVWSDSPTNPVDNVLPDLIGIAQNVDNGMWTSSVNFTEGDDEWTGVATFPSASPVSFYGSATTTVPVVITKLNASGVSEDPASFHYFRNISFADADFIYNDPTLAVSNVVKNDVRINAYPNPATNAVTLTGLGSLNATVKVIDVLGQTVDTQFHKGNETLRLNVSNLAVGIYTVHITGENINSSTSFVVQR